MMNRQEVKKILFISLSNLGDIILTTPAFMKIAEGFPGARIDVITGAAGGEIFTQHSMVDRVETREKSRGPAERLSELMELRRRRYDLVVDLRNSLIPYLSGARYHTGFTASKDPKLHKRDEHLARIARLGLDAFSDARFYVPVKKEDADMAEEATRGPGCVVVNPGAKSHLKRWEACKYALLADRISSELRKKVLITGNEDDTDVVAHVKSRMKEPALDICGRTSLGALYEVMRRSELVITNDSAPLHVASAAGTPTIAIFGPSDEKKYGPLAERSVALAPDVDCRPCGKALCSLGIVEGCISRVEVGEAFTAAERILNG